MTIQALAGAFGIYFFFIALVLAVGFYCLLVTSNLLRAFIGVEISIKAVTLLIILAGHLTCREELAQSLVITLIVIEVVLMVVAGGIALCVFRREDSISTNNLRRLKN